MKVWSAGKVIVIGLQVVALAVNLQMSGSAKGNFEIYPVEYSRIFKHGLSPRIFAISGFSLE